MIEGIFLFFVGLLLSAFFSGSETGFYRVTRMRLLLDGLAGDPVEADPVEIAGGFETNHA